MKPAPTYTRTQRTYTEAGTNESFAMYHQAETDQRKLVNETTGEEITPFYVCAFTDVDVKLNTGEIVSIPNGSFIRTNANRYPIARKFFIEKRFRKL